jgi:hypothetical protein
MSKSHSFDRLDFDAIWTAISRSKQLKDALDKTAADTQSECEKIARAVAYDEGDYKNSFDTAVVAGKNARRAFDNRARRRRGSKQRANRFIGNTNGDPDGGAYIGSIGTVFNTDFKARWVEFGSLAKGPRMVMNTAGRNVASASSGVDYETLYEAEYQQDTAELARRISQAKKS